MTASRPTAVLGAGALGLVTALRLAQRGDQVTIFEREPLPGGLASGFEVEPGIWLEKFYHHLFRSDRHAIGLIERARARIGPALVGASHRDPARWRASSPRLAGQPPALWPAARGGSPADGRGPRVPAHHELARQVGGPDGRQLDSPPHGSTPRYEVVWGPLLRGKFGDAADEIAMPWFWARVHDRTTQLGYLAGGFQRLYDALAARLEQLGVTLQFETTVEQISPADAGLSVTSRRPDGTTATESFDTVISTLPTRLTIRLTPSLPDAYRERHDWGRAYGAHCLILALDRPLTGRVLGQCERSGLPVHGPGGAHQLPAVLRVRRPAPPLPGQLSAHGRRALPPARPMPWRSASLRPSHA